jgi:hypothetical protein
MIGLIHSIFRRLGWFGSAPDERQLHPHIFTLRPSPPITVGTIVFHGLVKSLLIMFVLWGMTRYGYADQLWWWTMLILWLVVFYPAMRQYKQYSAYTASVNADSLCARCKHYDPTAINCTLLDEHISVYHIPCHGEQWEQR